MKPPRIPVAAKPASQNINGTLLVVCLFTLVAVCVVLGFCIGIALTVFARS